MAAARRCAAPGTGRTLACAARSLCSRLRSGRRPSSPPRCAVVGVRGPRLRPRRVLRPGGGRRAVRGGDLPRRASGRGQRGCGRDQGRRVRARARCAAAKRDAAPAQGPSAARVRRRAPRRLGARLLALGDGRRRARWRDGLVGLTLGVALLFVVFAAVRRERHPRWLVTGYICGAAAAALVGIFRPSYEEADRLAGGVGDPNFLAAMLVPALVFSVFALGWVTRGGRPLGARRLHRPLHGRDLPDAVARRPDRTRRGLRRGLALRRPDPPLLRRPRRRRGVCRGRLLRGVRVVVRARATHEPGSRDRASGPLVGRDRGDRRPSVRRRRCRELPGGRAVST